MEKQLGWAHKLGEIEPLGISKVGQIELVRLMESQIWHQPAGSMGGRGFRKGTMASAQLDARHFSFSLYTFGAFQAATPVLELRRTESKCESLCGFFKRNCLGLQNFLSPTNSRWFL